MVWNEQDHSRDDIGRFTFKDSGTLKGGIEKTQGGGKFSDLFSGFSLGEIKDLLLNVVTTALPTALKVGMGVFQLKNIIEANNLEKELMKEIKIARVRKEERKNNEEETTTRLTTNNRIGLSNKTTNTVNRVVNNKSKVKETAKDILYNVSNVKQQQKLKDDEYKNKLLDILGDKATQADVLYSAPKELEEKIREYELGEKLINIKKGYNKSSSNNIALGKKDINEIKIISADNKTINKSSLANTSKEYIKPTEKGYITSPYGYRIHPIYKRKILHDGVDKKFQSELRLMP